MYRRFSNSSQDCAQGTPTDLPEVLEVSFAFLPNNFKKPRIAVSFQQRLSYEGSFLKKPALSISALLPPDSEVFQSIEKGDLNGLIQSLSLRKAFLTDRDLEGRSLLNVSIVRAVYCGGRINPGLASMLSITHSQTYVNFSLMKEQMWIFLSHRGF